MSSLKPLDGGAHPESQSPCDESRQGASNCIAGIGQSAAEEGGKADRGCCKSEVVGTVGGLLHNNKNNNRYVRPCARVSASPDAVYGIPFETVVEAWKECEKNKRSSAPAIRFRWHSARELVKLRGRHDLPCQLRKRLKNRDYAARFIRPTYTDTEE